MESYRRARAFVLTGFSLSAVGAMINFVRMATSSYFTLGFTSSQIQSLLSPLTFAAAVWRRWWLSKVSITASEQGSFMRKAFLGLALQYVISTVVVLALLGQRPSFNLDARSVAPFWAQLFGAFAAAVGFFMMAGEFVPRDVVTAGTGPEI